MDFHGVSWRFVVFLRAAAGCFRISDDLMLKPKDTAAPSLFLFGSSQRSFAEYTKVHADETHDRDRWFVTILLGKP